MAFGICWAALVLFTNFGVALGHPADESAINPLKVLLWLELAALVVGVAVFIRAEMKDPDF